MLTRIDAIFLRQLLIHRTGGDQSRLFLPFSDSVKERILMKLKSISAARSIAALALVVMTLNSLGCGATVDDKFKGARGTVSGKVTFKGQPVPAKSTVLFKAKEGAYSASGIVNEKGEYSLSYNGSSSLPSVLYKVQIGPPPAKAEMVDPAKVVSGGAPTAPPPPFPAKYSDTSSSGLEYTVKAGANKADFDLVE